MNPEIKARWVAALRSGEYKQGRDYLHLQGGNGHPDKFCCLGVLCAIAVEDGVVVANSAGTSKGVEVHYIGVTDMGDRSEIALPDAVQEWAGLTSSEGILPLWTDEDRLQYSYSGENALLSGLNDQGLSFHDIANIIEEKL